MTLDFPLTQRGVNRSAEMTKALLGAAAAIALTAFAFTGTAQAQCWWTKGYNLQCSYPGAYGPTYYVPPAVSPVWPGGYPNYIYPDTGTYPPYWVMER
jgi:hypothetical protein